MYAHYFYFFHFQKNSYTTGAELSEGQKTIYRSQKILTQREMFDLVKTYNRTLLLNVRAPPRGHPYRNSYMNITLANILEAGVNEDDLV